MIHTHTIVETQDQELDVLKKKVAELKALDASTAAKSAGLKKVRQMWKTKPKTQNPKPKTKTQAENVRYFKRKEE